MKLSIKPRLLAAGFFIPIALLIAAVPNAKMKHKNISAEKVMQEVASGMQYISIDEAADYIVQKDPSILFVDVRDANEYDAFHLPNAENIPLKSIAEAENIERLQEPGLQFIFYSTGTVNANQAYTIARMAGVENVLVLSGGLNAWGDNIMNAKQPAASAPADEVARYQFHKAAAGATGAGTESNVDQSSDESPSTTNQPTAKRKKKKRAAGGC